MSAETTLLDTPKRRSLQSQSTEIRAALKEFERVFAADNNGRKPLKDDIRADADVAAKYKQYNKIRDVLAGKLSYETLVEAPKSPATRKHRQIKSSVDWTPRKKSRDQTPRKLHRHIQLDLHANSQSVSPKPVLLHAIGPTPQRDGKVLGLFDLLSSSAHSSKGTPSSRKRKLDTLVEESPDKNGRVPVAQTPSRRKVHDDGDLLDHSIGISGQTPETGNRKTSRTPVSEGRKFMLSQFFATPSAVRYSDAGCKAPEGDTPLRDELLGKTPDNTGSLQPAADATPAYLRRSTSFKDRLLSASQSTQNNFSGLMSPPATRAGPPTLKHLRSVTSLFSNFATKFSDIVEEDEADKDNHSEQDEFEDDLEALREIEDSHADVLVHDSQQQDSLCSGDEPEATTQNAQPLQKVYKKRGQKRTTRRAIMRPGKSKSFEAPQFVAAGEESEDEPNLSEVDETQIDTTLSERQATHAGKEFDDDDDFTEIEFDDSGDEKENKTKAKKRPGKEQPPIKKPSKKTPTINPNAVSHMNFRTLKIRNKNSKAKAKGRFGRGRR